MEDGVGFEDEEELWSVMLSLSLSLLSSITLFAFAAE